MSNKRGVTKVVEVFKKKNKLIFIKSETIQLN